MSSSENKKQKQEQNSNPVDVDFLDKGDSSELSQGKGLWLPLASAKLSTGFGI